MNSTRVILCSAIVATIAHVPLAAQASLAGPRIFPRGARCAGVESTTFNSTTQEYFFALKDENGATLVQYKIPLTHLSMQYGMLRVEETTTSVVPMAGGGMLYRDIVPPAAGAGRVMSANELVYDPTTGLPNPEHTLPLPLATHSLNTATNVVTLVFQDDWVVGGVPHVSEKKYDIRIVGKSLEIHATSNPAVRNVAQYNYAGFQFGSGDALPTPNLAFHLPYMDSNPVFVGAGGVFVTRMIDWYSSSASDSVTYSPTTTGTQFAGECAPVVFRNDLNDVNAAIDEIGYITVSHDVNDVMAVVDRHPSEYRRHLADRAVSQSAPWKTYGANLTWVQIAQSLGMSDMSHIKWDWSQHPFNLCDQDIIPALSSPGPTPSFGTIWGTPTEWITLTDTAANGNWTFAPYFQESNNDPGVYGGGGSLNIGGVLYPLFNNVYSASESVCDANGNPKLGWDTNLNLVGTNLQGHGHPVETLGPQFRQGYMQFFSNAIHGAFGHQSFKASGAHTDAATELPGGSHVDQRSASTFPKTIAENLKWRERSFGALKDGMEGPLFGENSHFRARAFETFNAGLVDGTSRKIPVNWSSGNPLAYCSGMQVVPDFELTEVATKATGFFGMGWESHFSASPWGDNDAFVDEWITTLLSFGHAPYFSTNGGNGDWWDWQRSLRSYYLCHGVSEAMRKSSVTSIRYEDSTGTLLNLSQALVAEAAGTLTLAKARLVLQFASGLVFKANHGLTDWTTVVQGVTYVIPPNGFVAAGAGGLLAYSAYDIVKGSPRVDYAFNPGHSEILDRRGINQDVNGMAATYVPYLSTLPQFTGVSPLDLCIVRDLRQNQVCFGSGVIQGTVALGAAPTLINLVVGIDDTTKLSAGRPRIGVRAVATDSNGNERDVTGLCSWVSSNPSNVTVNRFGGLAMVTNGTSTITATLASAGLTATRRVSATRAPIVSAIDLHALTSSKAFLSFTTDADCSATLQIVNQTTMATSTAVARPDPAKKVHHFALRSLSSATTYVVTPVAVNVGGLTTTGAAFTFTTL